MTWEEMMLNELGYETKTTFWDDFSIAERFGVSAIKDTYKRAMESWKDDYIQLTELALVLNHKIWYFSDKNREIALVYDELWRKASEYASNNLKGDELQYYFQTID